MELKEARKAMNEAGTHYRKADKNYMQSVKTGSEKQQTRCKTNLDKARDKYHAAYIEFHKIKSEAPDSNWSPKRIMTWTGLAVAVVATAIGATVIMGKNGESDEEPATDTV